GLAQRRIPYPSAERTAPGGGAVRPPAARGLQRTAGRVLGRHAECQRRHPRLQPAALDAGQSPGAPPGDPAPARSEEHTSELQSRENLVCRLLLEKKKKKRCHATEHK